MSSAIIWFLSLSTILAVLTRPFHWPEWVWASAGALLIVAAGLLPLTSACAAVQKGGDVYFFLVGMMLLSEQARAEGFFDEVATWATHHARGSAPRLFAILYGVGVIVTAFLSNDATAVVLTPAVYAAVKKAGASPIPYLFACAFIANAASFLLPISNPANLVVYGERLPRFPDWARLYALPSLAAILATYLVLVFWFRTELRQPLPLPRDHPRFRARAVAYGLVLVAGVLLAASARGIDLGWPTFLSASAIVALLSLRNRAWPFPILRHVAWGVLPMVAGLFVVVEAMNQAGSLAAGRSFFAFAAQASPLVGKLLAAFGVAIASNVANNLPVGLVAGAAAQGMPDAIRGATMIGVDLGPNLSVTGSLATLLWLIALRREGLTVSGWEFLRIGVVVMPVALLLAVAMI